MISKYCRAPRGVLENIKSENNILHEAEGRRPSTIYCFEDLIFSNTPKGACNIYLIITKIHLNMQLRLFVWKKRFITYLFLWRIKQNLAFDALVFGLCLLEFIWKISFSVTSPNHTMSAISTACVSEWKLHKNICITWMQWKSHKINIALL